MRLKRWTINFARPNGVSILRILHASPITMQHPKFSLAGPIQTQNPNNYLSTLAVSRKWVQPLQPEVNPKQRHTHTFTQAPESQPAMFVPVLTKLTPHRKQPKRSHTESMSAFRYIHTVMSTDRLWLHGTAEELHQSCS